MLNLNLRSKIDVNSVIGFLSVEKSVETAENLIENGFKTLKIKVGRDDFEEDYAVIKSIRHNVGDQVKIRIDANGNWNLNEAIANLKKIDDLDIEYAEQPVNVLDDYIELKNHCKFRMIGRIIGLLEKENGKSIAPYHMVKNYLFMTRHLNEKDKGISW